MDACQQCGAAPAAVNLTSIGGSSVTHERLCAACAEARGVALTPGATTPLGSFLQDPASRRDLDAALGPDAEPPSAS